MHFIYGMCNENARRHQHNRNRFPDHQVFMRVHNTYVEGTVSGVSARSGRPRIVVDAEEAITVKIQRNSPTSIRCISMNTGPQYKKFFNEKAVILSTYNAYKHCCPLTTLREFDLIGKC